MDPIFSQENIVTKLSLLSTNLNMLSFYSGSMSVYWTGCYSKSDVVPHVFVTCIDKLILIGKSIGLLRLIRSVAFCLRMEV